MDAVFAAAVLLGLPLMAIWAMSVAGNRGRKRWVWFLSGLVFGILAVIAAYIAGPKDKSVRPPSSRSARKLDKWLEHARGHFAPGEDALATVLGVYESKFMGSDSVRDGIFIATNQRLLFYTKKWIGFNLESLPYDKISSMEMGQGILPYISFFTSGNSAGMKWIRAGDVPTFVEVVQAQMGGSDRVIH